MSGESQRCTTWAYIARSIQRTMISQHGNGFSSNFGNFPENGAPPVNGNTRYMSLGHDSSFGPIKLDYIDTRLYEVCEKATFTDP